MVMVRHTSKASWLAGSPGTIKQAALAFRIAAHLLNLRALLQHDAAA